MHDVDTWMERMGKGDEEDSAGDRTAGRGWAEHYSVKGRARSSYMLVD